MFEFDIEQSRPIWKDIIFFISMIGVLVFANWAKPIDSTGIWITVFRVKWIVAGIFLTIPLFASSQWYKKEERKQGKFTGSKFICFYCRCIYVFCHID